MIHKVKQGMREVVAQSPLRVKLSLETCFSLRSRRSEEETEDFGATRVNTCEVCSREGHRLQSCAFCLCMFHPVRCKRLLEYAAGVDFASLVKEIQHSVCLPSCFFSEVMLCSMCVCKNYSNTCLTSSVSQHKRRQPNIISTRAQIYETKTQQHVQFSHDKSDHISNNHVITYTLCYGKCDQQFPKSMEQRLRKNKKT